MKKILFVDDENQILKSLVRLFMDSEYEIITAEGGEQALEILKENKVDLVISDMRMPNMDGYELLNYIKHQYPETMRMILSGYSDEKVVFKALQKNIAKMYMFKPWDNAKLLETVDQIFETEEILKGSQLLRPINNIENLPTIKANYQRILQLIEGEVNVAEIASEIERDTAISAKILHVANSAFFGAKTGSIKQAVSYIGLQNTKSLILSTSIIDSMETSGSAGKQIESIWTLAFVTNKLLSFIYEKYLMKKIPDNYASAGLLLNVGAVFFLKFYKEKYLKLLMTQKAKGYDQSEMEKEELGNTHSEVGAYLLKWWEFPYPIVEAALYHHDPLSEKVINKELVSAAYLASFYSMELCKCPGQECLDIRVMEFLKISKSDFEVSLSGFKI